MLEADLPPRLPPTGSASAPVARVTSPRPTLRMYGLEEHRPIRQLTESFCTSFFLVVHEVVSSYLTADFVLLL